MSVFGALVTVATACTSTSPATRGSFWTIEPRMISGSRWREWPMTILPTLRSRGSIKTRIHKRRSVRGPATSAVETDDVKKQRWSSYRQRT